MSKHLGEWGEQFVAQCLIERGWLILHQRWHCRWGEIDIIAQAPAPVQYLIFVEVKVRGGGNWDQMGLLSITPDKQQKLMLAAELFLAEYSNFANHTCRFDVALVTYKQKPYKTAYRDFQGEQAKRQSESNLVQLQDSNQAEVERRSFTFAIQHYIQGAFAAE